MELNVRKKLRREARGKNRNRLNSQWRSNVSVPSRKVRRGGERYLPLEPSAGSMLAATSAVLGKGV
jgi:hypothetical protein